MPIKNCKICNKEFYYSNFRKKTAKYCSFKCRNADYKGRHFSIKTEFFKGQVFSEERNKKIIEI